MGYMGLNHYQCSDQASDLAYDMMNAMAKVLKAGLKEKANVYNTNGIVNVAMIFRDLLIKNKDCFAANHALMEVATKTKDMLLNMVVGETLEDYGDTTNYEMHTGAYREMLKALEEFIDTDE